MDFYTAFIRPMFPAISVSGFVFAGGANTLYVVAAGVAMFLTFLEIGRQGGWK